MNDKKLEILKDIFGDCKKEGNQHLFFCPFCPIPHHKPKLSFNLDKNKFKCWVCLKSGSDIKKVIQEYGSFQHLREWRELEGITDFSEIEYFLNIVNNQKPIKKEKEKISLPEEFRTLVSNDLSVEGEVAKRYLIKRGITQKDIFLYRMGYCVEGKYKDRVIIPSFDENGFVNYFISRSWDKNEKKKYLYPHLNHNEVIINELFIDWNEPIILVEGIFDAIKAGIQAIPLLGNELSTESKLFQKIIRFNCKVFLALDPDAKAKELAIAKNLIKYGISVSKITIPNNFKDVGEMSKEQFEEVKNNNTFSLTNSSIMRYNLDMI